MMDINLIDKISLVDTEILESRDLNLRQIINHKIYDTTYEDNIAKYIITSTKWKDMLLIRYDYYLSKIYHGFGKGDMVFFNKKNNILYVIQLKSLKDNYSNLSNSLKIEKCIQQSIKYAKYAEIWAEKEAIPVTAIEYLNGDIITRENNNNAWENSPWKKEEITEDKWFNDQTLTRYKIVGDTLEAEKFTDSEPNYGIRKLFRKRVKAIAKDCTNCTKYLLTVKNLDSDIIMQEFNEVNSSDEL